MGQYYHPVSVEKLQYVRSHDYGNGLKLMEHSYIGNHFVKAVEGLISKEGSWYGDRIVWAGDYADDEPGQDLNLYHLSGDNENITPPVPKEDFKFLVNLDTKEYVKLSSPNTKALKIHPLPLLTCEGNGRGGGDYRGNSPLVGIWARNRVVMENEVPKGFKKIIFKVTE
jgi:hypothetical protein